MFDPTEKQLCALANMERYAGIGSNRTQFTNLDEFNEYWKRVSDRCDKQSQQQKRQHEQREQKGSAGIAKQLQHKQKRKQQRIDNYYQNKDALLRYAEKYKNRYLPSRQKLVQQLSSKCKDETTVAAVMAIVDPQINDAATALERASRMQAQGKNIQYIKTKLRQRLYDAACIQNCITALTYESGSIWSHDTLIKRIEQLQRQGKSMQHIRQKLSEQSSDRPLVEAALQEIFGDDGDQSNIEREYDKLIRKNTAADKIVQRLISKGFRYADIVALQRKKAES